MRLVIVESPYAGDIERNLHYARLCLHDCLLRGEAPFASHLLYTQESVLDDKVPEERKLGISAGLIWGSKADATVVYIDHGISNGMDEGIKRAIAEKRPIEYRGLFTKVSSYDMGTGILKKDERGKTVARKKRFDAVLRVRIPRAIYQSVKMSARRRGVSMSQVVREAIEKALDRIDKQRLDLIEKLQEELKSSKEM